MSQGAPPPSSRHPHRHTNNSSNLAIPGRNPHSLRPQQHLSTSDPVPANRIQKDRTTVKEEPGLKSSYKPPSRLSRVPCSPKTSSNPTRPLNPLPNHRISTSNTTYSSPLLHASRGTATTRIKVEDVTSLTSSTSISLRSIPAAMDPPVPIKCEAMDPPVPVKCEPVDDVEEKETTLWNTPAEKEIFFFRYRLQKIAKAAKKDGLSPTGALEIQQIFTKLSTLPWEPGMYDKSRIEKAVKLVSGPQSIYGEKITKRAKELVRRWKAGEFSPRPFEDAEDEIDDSDDESFDDGPTTGVRPAASPSQREVVKDCVARLTQGMIITRGKSGTRQYKLDPRYNKKPADVFGHNGLNVGDWWPFQSFTLRDGAHGAKMGGIYGRVQIGAFSLVISGGTYDDNDFDRGDRVLYSGSKGGDEEDAKSSAPLTSATQSLIMSTRHQKPVRVLRSARGASKWAPSAGIRYDGLYSVESYSIKTDRELKKFYQFVLVRISDQPPIVRTRPTAVEIHALDRIREM